MAVQVLISEYGAEIAFTEYHSDCADYFKGNTFIATPDGTDKFTFDRADLSEVGRFVFDGENHKLALRGLKESRMVDFTKFISRGGAKDSQVYKGTTFGGKSKNSFSTCARILKEGLPDGMTVHSRVLWDWTRKDLLEYVMKIEKALKEKRAKEAEKNGK